MAKQFSVRALPNYSDLEDLGYPDILQRLFYQRGVTNKYDVQTGLSQLISAFICKKTDVTSKESW